MKNLLFLLIPFWVCGQSYVMPNVNGKGITTDVMNDTLKITSLTKIKDVEIFSDEFNYEVQVNANKIDIPIDKMPIGRHALSIMVGRRMIIYWLVVDGILEPKGAVTYMTDDD
ncbi:hypothetical protein LRR18_07585 [Mangrovimonas sp. AS39]|uniref:hypothetical protein n=1 Tax=Mangrovimonas TaxID=1211036 RepID=UPI0012FA1FDD|nr:MULTISPECIES: hypothetical protein [Mangrovimonas]MCF1191442.1 hypothetical protein [Mangrovimonas futianensis]MCF1195137.1 hypothetical protein [Mangrovimonas futianensis]MCF1421186.1 hypothetical protein [Mangrovimonas futianensis]